MEEKAPPLPVNAQGASSSGDLQAGGDESRGRYFPCEGCGADLEFHIDDQQLTCPYCGFTKEIEVDENAAVSENDLKEAARRLSELRSRKTHQEAGLKEISCESCGAVVQFSGTITSKQCAYCDSPIQLENAYEAPHRIPVDGVLPFAVDRDSAFANLRKWVQSRWFAPNEFKRRGVQGKFNGLYIPFWTFDAMTVTNYTGQRGDNYTVTTGSGKNRRTEIRIRWSWVSGRIKRFFDDVLVVASGGLPEQRINDLEPWPLKKCEPFKRDYLAGFLARKYDIDLDEGFLTARNRIDEAIERDIRSNIGGDHQIIDSVNTNYSAMTYKHLLLPLWMLTYRYHEKPYQVVVNAATGEVQGDRPYIWIKITLAVLAGLAAIGAAYYFAANQ